MPVPARHQARQLASYPRAERAGRAGYACLKEVFRYPDDKVRNVTENASTLKFEVYGFEDQ